MNAGTTVYVIVDTQYGVYSCSYFIVVLFYWL